MGCQEVGRELAGFVPALVGAPAIYRSEGEKDQQRKERAQPQPIKAISDKRAGIPGRGAVFQERFPIAEPNHRQHNQSARQPHGTSDTVFIFLGSSQFGPQLLTLSRAVVSDQSSQKSRLSFVLVHCSCKVPGQAVKAGRGGEVLAIGHLTKLWYVDLADAANTLFLCE